MSLKTGSRFPINLKLALDETIKIYSHDDYLASDPILFPKQYNRKEDIEIISLLSCLFAYGNVRSIKSFLAPIFQTLGPTPYHSLATRDDFYTKALKEISYYRFQTKADNIIFLKAISSICEAHRKSKTNSPIFESAFLDDGVEFEPIFGISKFQKFLESNITFVSDSKALSPGLRFLIGDPQSKSPKKRICLFLRWMVRDGFPDFGIYKQIRKEQLAFPLDVHIQRLIKILGISKRKTFILSEAKLVSEYFKLLNPDDPLLYDFFLTRVGMIQKCKGVKVAAICNQCKLEDVCLIGSATGN